MSEQDRRTFIRDTASRCVAAGYDSARAIKQAIELADALDVEERKIPTPADREETSLLRQDIVGLTAQLEATEATARTRLEEIRKLRVDVGVVKRRHDQEIDSYKSVVAGLEEEAKTLRERLALAEAVPNQAG